MRDVRQIVFGITRKVGLEVRRRPRILSELEKLPPSPTRGLQVEIIGSEGVGKSTLAAGLFPHLRRDWLFRSDLLSLGPGGRHDDEIARLHRDLYMRLVDRLRQDQSDPWRTITLLRQKGEVLAESLTIATHDFPRGFFHEEGLVKGLPEEILALPDEVARPLWEKRVFVYLRTEDPDLIVSRYQGRAAARRSRGLPIELQSDAEIRERAETFIAVFDRVLDRARAFGCPALVLSPEDRTELNVGRVLAFERTLREGISA